MCTVLFLVACADSFEAYDPSKNIVISSEQQKVSGTWENTKCKLQGNWWGYNETYEIEISPNQKQVIWRTFVHSKANSTNSCSSLALIVETVFSANVTPSTRIQDVFNFDTTYKHTTITPKTEAAVNFLKTGTGDATFSNMTWELNKKSAPFVDSSVPTHSYDIVMIDDTQRRIYWGNTNGTYDSSSINKRPTSIDTNNFETRK